MSCRSTDEPPCLCRGPGQLARECKAGVWLTAAASSSFVLQQGQDGEAMWHQVRCRGAHTCFSQFKPTAQQVALIVRV